jgi:hypothetical protein
LLLDRTGQFFWPVLVVSVVLWIGVLPWIFVVGPIEPVEWGQPDSALIKAEPAYSN